MGTSRRSRAGGYTLIELVAALGIMAILIVLAAPSLTGLIVRWRVNAALDQIRADVYYARMVAISSGVPVEMRFIPSQSRVCLERYEIMVLGDPERRVKELRVPQEFPGVCLAQGRPYGIRFNRRGLPRVSDNRTILATQSAQGDSMTLSSAGRLYRIR